MILEHYIFLRVHGNNSLHLKGNIGKLNRICGIPFSSFKRESFLNCMRMMQLLDINNST